MKTNDVSQCVPKDDRDSDEVINVANEIMEYLHDHPNAADSLDGVVSWWLTRQRFKSAREIVERALEYLVDEGVVNKKIRGVNNPVYSNVTTDDKTTKH